MFFSAAAWGAAAQTGTSAARPQAETQVVACPSLANLRFVLRSARDDTAVTALINDSKKDLGCAVLDRKAVTGIADHVALNGQAYDCVGLAGTSICHWTVAGAVALPAASPNASSRAPKKDRR